MKSKNFAGQGVFDWMMRKNIQQRIFFSISALAHRGHIDPLPPSRPLFPCSPLLNRIKIIAPQRKMKTI